MRAIENKAILQCLYDHVYNEGGVALLDELVARSAVEHEAAPGVEGCVAATLREFVLTWRAAFPDLHARVHRMAVAGERVTADLTLEGTHLGPFLGICPSYRRIVVPARDTVRIVEGRIVERWGYTDSQALMRQLGIDLDAVTT